MGNVTQIPERSRMVVERIRTEHDALAAISHLFPADGQHAHPSGNGRVLNFETIAQVGLTGISVPEVDGGADVANAVIAELFLGLGDSGDWLSLQLLRHFHSVEILRLLPDTRLRSFLHERVLLGECFTFHDTVLRMEVDGSGFRFSFPDDKAADHDGTDWTLYPVIWNETHKGIAIVQTKYEIRAYVEPDRILELDVVLAQTSAQALANLLEAAIETARARTRLHGRLGRLKPGNGHANTSEFADLGSLSVDIEAATALIKRSAQLLDVAQVSRHRPSTQDAIIGSLYAVASARRISKVFHQGIVAGSESDDAEKDRNDLEVLAAIGSSLISASDQ